MKALNNDERSEGDAGQLDRSTHREHAERMAPMLAYVVARVFNRKEEDVPVMLAEAEDRGGEPTTSLTIDGSLIAFRQEGAWTLDRIVSGFDPQSGPWEDFEPAGSFASDAALVGEVVGHFAAVAAESLLESYDTERGGDAYANNERDVIEAAREAGIR